MESHGDARSDAKSQPEEGLREDGPFESLMSSSPTLGDVGPTTAPAHREVEVDQSGPDVTDGDDTVADETASGEGSPRGSFAELVASVQELAANQDERTLYAEVFRSRSEAQDDLIRRLQRQVEDLRADQVRSLLKPLVVVLADLHADMRRVQAMNDGSLSSGDFERELELFSDQIVDAIGALGLDSVGAEAGQVFDRTLHTATRRIDTSDPTLDQQIATVRRQGFSAPEDPKPLLFARVDVFRLNEDASGPPEVPEPETQTTTEGPIHQPDHEDRHD